MCRYSDVNYKTHWVCFDCRVTFKQPSPRFSNYRARCPRCSREMVDLGHDFKPPRKHEERQWQKLDLLRKMGITFHSCGCEGPGPRPGTLAEAKVLFRERAAQQSPTGYMKWRKGRSRVGA